MELRQIRYFQCVAEELSFTKAAARLHMAQPPLSRQIRQLEQELGAELFERLGRSIRLTDAGRFFLDQVSQVSRRLEDIAVATRRIAEKRKKWFGIGFVPSTLYGFVPAFVRQVIALDDQFEIGLAEMTTVQQFDALKTGHIDVGVGRILLEDPEIERLVLVDEPLMVVVPRNHRLSRHARVRLEDILSEPLILYPAKPRPSYADHVVGLLEKHGHVLKIAIETNEMQTAVGLVATGLGITLVPGSVHRLHRDDIDYLALDAPDFTSPIMMSWLKKNDSPFLKEVIGLAKKSAIDYYGQGRA
ncbi:LysR family transcriptional regulator [Paralcaligenes sp. KSB-10]|uniref:LysR family transcriptional regulator n=1 Tax=Paralcaligenes sp. KSB-10 TaxID=2901142 RepID=UPI001E331B31|nr:LysR family transcriptional regulator [Paralcaligenes sp. KSB-10]UHL63680.1 LysR family transcriptional regulator [Paralcaligenes sp. KSB-10]